MRKRSIGASLLATVPLILLAATLVFWVITAMSLKAGGALSAAASQEVVQRTVNDIVNNLKQGRMEQADALFKAWVRIAGGGSNAYTVLASGIMQKGHPEAAARYLLEATKNSDVNWDPMLWATLAEAQNKVRDTLKAEQSAAEAERRAAAFLKQSEKAPDSKRGVLEQIGRIDQVASYYSTRDPERSITLLERALRLDENPQTLNSLGYMLADRGTTSEDFSRAVVLTKKAVEKSPNDPMILDSYGWALFKTNDLAGARRVLREAVDDAPTMAEIRYHLGIVFAQLGLTTDAERELDRALVLDPDNASILKAKKLLHLPPGQGILDKA